MHPLRVKYASERLASNSVGPFLQIGNKFYVTFNQQPTDAVPGRSLFGVRLLSPAGRMQSGAHPRFTVQDSGHVTDDSVRRPSPIPFVDLGKTNPKFSYKDFLAGKYDADIGVAHGLAQTLLPALTDPKAGVTFAAEVLSAANAKDIARVLPSGPALPENLPVTPVGVATKLKRQLGNAVAFSHILLFLLKDKTALKTLQTAATPLLAQEPVPEE